VFSGDEAPEREPAVFTSPRTSVPHLLDAAASTSATPVLATGSRSPRNSRIAPLFGKRTVTILGDGGFWHNGLTSGIANAVFNRDDRHPRHHENGYTSATAHREHSPPRRTRA